MLNRRQFLGSILALAAAPAIVRAGSLMKVPVRRGRWMGWLNGEEVWGGQGMFDGATLTIYSGGIGEIERPLVSMPLPFKPACGGVLEAMPAHGVVIGSGVARMFKLLDRGANELMRGSVGGPHNWADMNLTHDVVVPGSHLSIDTFQLTMNSQNGPSSSLRISEALRNRMLDNA